MTEFLLFTMYAPLSSWGEIAVGEVRGSWDRPSRSAILGFLAAAVGLVRDDAESHAALDTGYGVAVRLDSAGVALTDFHTAQTASAMQVKRRQPETRAQLLDTAERETILSRRVYRQDALATVAVWQRHDARWSLATIADALRRPAFVLYAGRKANALGLPVDPEVMTASNIAEAFAARTHERAQRAGFMLERLRIAHAAEVSHDTDPTVVPGVEHVRSEIRRDTSPHRTRWQFSERVVNVFVMPGAGVVGHVE